MKKLFSLLLITVCLVTMTSCFSFAVNWNFGSRIAVALNEDSLTEEQARLIAMDYKCQFETRYADVLGEDFWETETEEGDTFQDYVKEYFIFAEIRAVMYLDSLSGDYGIGISEVEAKDLREASDRYFESLSAEELEWCGASDDDAYEVFRRYYLAEKTADRLLDGKTVDVSEEESRVADIQVIRVGTLNEAENISLRLEDGESFLKLAEECSLDDVISYSVTRDELTDLIGETVFSMNDGDISEILNLEDGYYIIRLESSYDALLSSKNREEILADRRFAGWEAVMDEASVKTEIKRDRTFWNDLTLKTEEPLEAHDLFEAMEF